MAVEVAAVIAVLVAVSAAVAALFRYIRQPVVLGYVIAGVLLSMVSVPLLGVITGPPGVTPVLVADVAGGIASLGIVLLLFTIGLEFNLRRLRSAGLRLVLIGSVEMLVVIAAGYWLGVALGLSNLQAGFLGAAIGAASTTVIVKVLQEEGRAGSEEASLVIGILIVEDLIVVIMLTVLAGFQSQGAVPFVSVAVVVLKIGVFMAASIALGLLLVPRLVDRIAALGVPEVLMMAGLGLGFTMALFSLSLGLSEALGAFVMGLIVGEAKSAEKVRDSVWSVRDLFVAMFFVGVGMLIDFGAIGHVGWLLAGLVVAAVFIVAKFGAVVWSALLGGTEVQVALKAGLTMLALGEFSLVVAKLAVDSNVFPGTAGGGFLWIMLLASLVTTTVASQVIRRAQRIDAAISLRLPEHVRRFSLSLGLFRRALGAPAAWGAMGQVRAELRRIGLALLVLVSLLALTAIGLAVSPELARLAQVEELWVQILLIGLGATFSAPALIDSVRRAETIIEILARDIELGTEPESGVDSGSVARVLRGMLIAGVTLVVSLSSMLVLSTFSWFRTEFLLLLVPAVAIIVFFFWGSLKAAHSKFTAAVAVHGEVPPPAAEPTPGGPSAEPPPVPPLEIPRER